MDDLQQICELTRLLKIAASEKDWQQVQAVDQQVALLLSRLSGQPLADTQRSALKTLQHTHHLVHQHCRRHSELLEQKMLIHRRNQEGALAYALFMTSEDLR